MKNLKNFWNEKEIAMDRLKTELVEKISRIELISEADLQDDLSDDSSEEILEVEINAEDISEFVQELKQINGLDTEVVCDEDIDINDFEPELDNDFDNTDIFFQDNIDIFSPMPCCSCHLPARFSLLTWK